MARSSDPCSSTAPTRDSLTRTSSPAGDVTPWARYLLVYAFLFLMGAETFLISPLLPRIAADLHSSTSATAQLVTAYVLAYAVTAPLLGGVSDRVPRRTFITAGGTLFMAGNLLCALADTLPSLLAARAVTGLGGAAAAPAMWAYLSETSAAHQRGRAVSGGVACYALGQVLGVPAGSTLAQVLHWRWAFALIAAILLPLLPLIAWRLRGPKPVRAGSFLTSFTIWRDPRIAWPLLSTGLLQAGRLGAYTYTGALFAHRYGFSTGRLGMLGILVGAGTLTGSLISGRLTDAVRSRGRNENWLSAGFALLFLCACATALLTHHLMVSVTALFVWFLAGGAFYTTQQTYLGNIEPRHRAGIVSFNSTLDHAGVALGTTVLALWPLAGTGFVLTTLAFGLTAAALSTAATRFAPDRQSAPGL
ncbi:MFS transporter [Streptomyces galbus]|uniref:MFS transporter n=1 Tax=Streptomyces galbus TaxID=33898 RepID=A0A4U5WVX4_STRGB|nr:MFS transporter [Streptomyces galbus]TKT06644.1 MFS transporter [Streptomyces galbus]GHD53529.1 putative MFS-type transporter YwfA [Streptomyces galbus]